MKRLAAAALLALTGCASMRNLPPITADSFHYSRHDTAGGTEIVAEGVAYDQATKTVRAKSVTWTTIYPFVSFSVTVKNYVQAPLSPP